MNKYRVIAIIFLVCPSSKCLPHFSWQGCLITLIISQKACRKIPTTYGQWSHFLHINYMVLQVCDTGSMALHSQALHLMMELVSFIQRKPSRTRKASVVWKQVAKQEPVCPCSWAKYQKQARAVWGLAAPTAYFHPPNKDLFDHISCSQSPWTVPHTPPLKDMHNGSPSAHD